MNWLLISIALGPASSYDQVSLGLLKTFTNRDDCYAMKQLVNSPTTEDNTMFSCIPFADGNYYSLFNFSELKKDPAHD